MRVRLLSSAAIEVSEAFDHYNAVDDDGRTADRFLDELEQAKRSIAERPRAWTEIEPGVPWPTTVVGRVLAQPRASPVRPDQRDTNSSADI
jgi:hypothetical protein